MRELLALLAVGAILPLASASPAVIAFAPAAEPASTLASANCSSPSQSPSPFDENTPLSTRTAVYTCTDTIVVQNYTVTSYSQVPVTWTQTVAVTETCTVTKTENKGVTITNTVYKACGEPDIPFPLSPLGLPLPSPVEAPTPAPAIPQSSGGAAAPEASSIQSADGKRKGKSPPSPKSGPAKIPGAKASGIQPQPSAPPPSSGTEECDPTITLEVTTTQLTGVPSSTAAEDCDPASTIQVTPTQTPPSPASAGSAPEECDSTAPLPGTVTLIPSSAGLPYWEQTFTIEGAPTATPEADQPYPPASTYCEEPYPAAPSSAAYW